MKGAPFLPNTVLHNFTVFMMKIFCLTHTHIYYQL